MLTVKLFEVGTRRLGCWVCATDLEGSFPLCLSVCPSLPAPPHPTPTPGFASIQMNSIDVFRVGWISIPHTNGYLQLIKLNLRNCLNMYLLGPVLLTGDTHRLPLKSLVTSWDSRVQKWLAEGCPFFGDFCSSEKTTGHTWVPALASSHTRLRPAPKKLCSQGSCLLPGLPMGLPISHLAAVPTCGFFLFTQSLQTLSFNQLWLWS